MSTFEYRPLLAATLDTARLEDLPYGYNLWASPKLDGFRCIIHQGQAVSRNLKPIPNEFVQAKLKGLPEGTDGELVCGSPTGEGVFNRTSSGVTARDGEPNFMFWVFDNWAYNTADWRTRYAATSKALNELKSTHVCMVPHATVPAMRDLLSLERMFLDEGYEGMMVRRGDLPYKFGRSTPRSGHLWKLKRFRDGEVLITDVYEGVTNTNVPTRAPDGSIERSTMKAGLLPNGQVGTIIGKDLQTGETITMSAGRMTHTERRRYFLDKNAILGKIAKYKAFDYGAVDAPRFCTFQGFRTEIDL